MLSHSANEDKWVCPSDRHLLLRAKLNSGWSVRASSNKLPASSVTSHETEQIKQVLKRAHCLDTTEQKRIGVMIHGLEEMRKKCSGDGHSTCVLCAEEFRKFIGVSPVTCQDCRKKVCSKCSVECSSVTTRRESADMLNQGIPYQLCKICSEGREVWKRSGAWFFRTLPRFILPEVKPTHTSRYVTSSTMITEGDSQVSLLPSDGRLNQRRSLSRRKSSSSDSSDCELKVKEAFSGTDADDVIRVTHSIPSVDPITCRVPVHPSGTTSNSADFNRSSLNSSGAEMSNFRENSDCLSPSEPCSQDTILLASDRSDLMGCPLPGPGCLGFLSFNLRYDENKSALFVTVVCARELISKDLNGYSDPYVNIELLPGIKKVTKLRTKTKYKTLNPDFNETLVYHGVEENDLCCKKLRLQVRDEDRFRQDDFIGEVTVILRHLAANETKSFTTPLTMKQRKGKRRSRNKIGRILLSLRFDEENSLLLVNPVKCDGLASVARSNNVSLQVKVFLHLNGDATSDDVILESTDWTKVKDSSAEFDIVLRFPIGGGIQELSRCVLEINLWNKGVTGRERMVGSLSLRGESDEDLLTHWHRCLESSGTKVEMWHQLTSTKQRHTSRLPQ